MVDHSNMKLGKKAAVHDPLVPQLVKLMRTPSAPPPSADWTHGITSWGQMENDVLGDCTAAAAAHFLQAMTAAARVEFTAPDKQVVAFYSGSTGYKPGHPETDQGGVEVYVLRYLLKHGLCGHHIVGFGSIDPKDINTLKRTVADLGGAYIGVSLPTSAQTQDVWGEGGAGGDDTPGSWGGHAVAVLGYDATHIRFVSWGKVMKMTWAFWSAYVDEAYGILWAAMIKDGKSPAGIDVAALTAEVEALKAA